MTGPALLLCFIVGHDGDIWGAKFFVFFFFFKVATQTHGRNNERQVSGHNEQVQPTQHNCTPLWLRRRTEQVNTTINKKHEWTTFLWRLRFFFFHKIFKAHVNGLYVPPEHNI